MYPGSLGPPLADHVSQLDERARKPAEAILRTASRRVSRQAAADHRVRGHGFSWDSRPGCLDRGFPGRLHHRGLGRHRLRTRTSPAACSGRGPITTTAGISSLSAPSGRSEWSRSTASPKPHFRLSAMRSEGKTSVELRPELTVRPGLALKRGQGRGPRNGPGLPGPRRARSGHRRSAGRRPARGCYSWSSASRSRRPRGPSASSVGT